MTSDGILGFVDDLHAIATRMDHEETATPHGGQAFLGAWTDYLNHEPFEDVLGAPRGLLSLVNWVRGPTHIINPTVDFERLQRFNARLQALWDQGQPWSEPRPPDRTPGTSGKSASSQLENAATLALVVGVIWLLSRK